MLQAEADHRRHAIIEQVIADLKNGPLAHLPSGKFNANGAWLVLAAMAFNLTRAAGALASLFHARATTATIRTPADQRPRPASPLRPPHPPATTDELALGRRLARPVHRRARATRRSHRLTTGPHGHDQTISGKAGQTGSPATPAPRPLEPRSTELTDNSVRCIRAKLSGCTTTPRPTETAHHEFGGPAAGAG